MAQSDSREGRNDDTWTELAKAAVKSRLLTADAIQDRSKSFLSGVGQKNRSAARFAKFLIESGDLTKFQAERLLAGRTEGFFLGGCRILDRLGAGGMGIVYLAEQIQLGRQVAVKVLPSKRIGDAEFVQRFLREARAAAELNHPNIVQIYDFGNVGNSPFIVMEFVRGPDLKEVLIKEGPFSVASSVEIISHVAIGLQHAHDHGIVHRDIKPSNIVQVSGAVKILDLGLARRVNDSAELTEVGSGLGTPDYMSPEQFTDARQADIRSDLYSLGCTWYHLLAGQPPFDGGTPATKGIAHMQQVPTPIEQLVPTVPAKVSTIIQKLMAKRPEDRFQTPRQLLDDINTLTSKAPETTHVWRPERAAESPPDVPSTGTPQPLAETCSDSLITVPRSSVPAFLLHLLPVMAALVLGGAYFGIQALLQRAGESNPIVIDLPHRSEMPAVPDTKESQNPDEAQGPNVAAIVPEMPDEGGAQLPEQPENQKTPVEVRESAPRRHEVKPPAVPAAQHEPQIWTVASGPELQSAIEQSRDGDSIHIDTTRTIEVPSLKLNSKRLVLRCTKSPRHCLLEFPISSGTVALDGIVQVIDGELTLENIDLYLDVSKRTATDAELTWFHLSNANLRLVNCSVTVERGNIDSRSPVVLAALHGAHPWGSQDLGNSPPPRQISLQGCFVRGAHTVALINSRQAMAFIEDTIVCGPRELIHLFHTEPLQFAHHKIAVEIGGCTLDLAGPVFRVDCRPFDLKPVPIEIALRKSWVLSPRTGSDLPPQVVWETPVIDQIVSSTLRWTGDTNVYYQRSDGLLTKTPTGPVAVLVKTPDDWKLQALGSEIGWREFRNILKVPRTPWHLRMTEDYRFAREGGADTSKVARPPKRPSQR